MAAKIQKVNLTSSNLSEEKLKELRKILPEAFSENKIDWDSLKTVLGDEIDPRTEKFNFTWAGKSDAVRNVLIPGCATLRAAQDVSVDFGKAENLFIEGDNLEVLKLLQKAYFEKVKMIYIDPPYNTGSDFIYKDDFKSPVKCYLAQTGQMTDDGQKLQTNKETSGRFHSNWLSMMYPRLKLAWNLLREDGVIFVSIDDNEVHHLRMTLDEVFGEENFIAQIPWKGKGGGADNRYLMVAHEYILCYSKTRDLFTVGEEKKEATGYNKIDEKGGKYKISLARKWGANSRREDRPNLFYGVSAPDGTITYPKLPNGKDGCWRFSLKRMLSEIEEGLIEFQKADDGSWTVYEKEYEPKEGEILTKKISTWFDDVGSTASGSKELLSIFGEKIFSFPKPTSLIQKLIEVADANSNGDIILDFFAGSGTTAHAVLKQNQEDGIDRRFILVQLPEIIDAKEDAYKAGYKTIGDIAIARIGKVLKGFGKEPKPIHDGFKVFRLGESNYPENNFELDPEKSEAESRKAYEEYLNKAKQSSMFEKMNELDVVYENIVKEGLSLNAKVETAKLGKNKVFTVTDGERTLLVCLDNKIEVETVKELTDRSYKDKVFICIDSALDDTAKANLGLNLELKTI